MACEKDGPCGHAVACAISILIEEGRKFRAAPVSKKLVCVHDALGMFVNVFGKGIRPGIVLMGGGVGVEHVELERTGAVN